MHRDPTFDEVARRESRDCYRCIEYSRLWGLEYCNKRKWAGVKNMRRCNEFTYRKDSHD